MDSDTRSNIKMTTSCKWPFCLSWLAAIVTYDLNLSARGFSLFPFVGNHVNQLC